MTVRTTAFEADESTGGAAAQDKLDAPEAPKNSEFVGQELSKSDRYSTTKKFLQGLICQRHQLFVTHTTNTATLSFIKMKFGVCHPMHM